MKPKKKSVRKRVAPCDPGTQGPPTRVRSHKKKLPSHVVKRSHKKKLPPHVAKRSHKKKPLRLPDSGSLTPAPSLEVYLANQKYALTAVDARVSALDYRIRQLERAGTSGG